MLVVRVVPVVLVFSPPRQLHRLHRHPLVLLHAQFSHPLLFPVAQTHRLGITGPRLGITHPQHSRMAGAQACSQGARRGWAETEKCAPARHMVAPPWLRQLPGKQNGKRQTPRLTLFRAMRSDGQDLVAALAKFVESGMFAAEGTVDWFRTVLRAVDCGSSEASPFVHFSTKIEGASRWHKLAEQARNEIPEKQLLVELDLWEWTQLGELEGIAPLGPDSIIDLSTKAAQADFLNSFPDWSGREKGRYEEVLRQYPHALKKALDSSEVLVKWRGMVPIGCMHVIDTDGRRSGRSLLTHMLERNERVVEHVWFWKIGGLRQAMEKANPMSPAGSGDFHGESENATRSPTDAESEGSQRTVSRNSNRSVATRKSSKDPRVRSKKQSGSLHQQFSRTRSTNN